MIGIEFHFVDLSSLSPQKKKNSFLFLVLALFFSRFLFRSRSCFRDYVFFFFWGEGFDILFYFILFCSIGSVLKGCLSREVKIKKSEPRAESEMFNFLFCFFFFCEKIKNENESISKDGDRAGMG